MDRSDWIFWILAGVFATGMFVFMAGCSLMDSHEKQFDVIRGTAMELTKRMPLSASQVQVSGALINPGVRMSAGIEYYVQGTYVGVSGTVGAAGQGSGDYKTGISAEELEEIARVYADQSLSVSERADRLIGFVEKFLATTQPSE